jgi:hypothetical protein
MDQAIGHVDLLGYAQSFRDDFAAAQLVHDLFLSGGR